jgi:hypothetical protein
MPICECSDVARHLIFKVQVSWRAISDINPRTGGVLSNLVIFQPSPVDKLASILVKLLITPSASASE